MVSPAIGSVVLVRFPFSDLSATKLRPAAVLAAVDRDDWILCQITSNPYADVKAVEIIQHDFSSGSLSRVSYARPGKTFHRKQFHHGKRSRVIDFNKTITGHQRSYHAAGT